MRTATARLVALGLILSACSAGVAETADSTTTTLAATTTTSTTSTTLAATTTTVPGEPVSPINGLPVTDPTTLERRVLAVKIDNHAKANPQSGIDKADMIIELRVEGITRYITIWHQSDSDYLGPMRSGRPTDPTLLRAMNQPTLAISGAQDWVQSIMVSKDVHLIGEIGPPATFRISGRSAPHDLYVNTHEMRAHADSMGYPNQPPAGPLWKFGPMSTQAEMASVVRVRFGPTVTWTWDEAAGLWLRSTPGREDTYRNQDGSEGRIGVPVLIALYVQQYTASPPAGSGGSSVPASITTGLGKAFLFAEGKVVEGSSSGSSSGTPMVRSSPCPRVKCGSHWCPTTVAWTSTTSPTSSALHRRCRGPALCSAEEVQRSRGAAQQILGGRVTCSVTGRVWGNRDRQSHAGPGTGSCHPTHPQRLHLDRRRRCAG